MLSIEPPSKRSKDYGFRTLFHHFDTLPWDYPVEVNFHESTAFARWKSHIKSKIYRLPTEAEFRSYGIHSEDIIDFKTGIISNINVNIGLKFTSPTPVNYYLPSTKGIYDYLGNVWQLLSTNFAPIEDDIHVHNLYSDFSTPFYNDLNIMSLGGSFMSCGHSTSVYYRLWWRKHFVQNMGFRLIEEDNYSIKEIKDIGKGVFSRKNFKVGDIVYRFKPSEVIDKVIESIDELKEIYVNNIKTVLEHSTPGKTGKIYVFKDTSPIYYENHSSNPNICSVDWESVNPDFYIDKIAKCNINIGDEITVDYNGCVGYDVRKDVHMLNFITLCDIYDVCKRPSQFTKV